MNSTKKIAPIQTVTTSTDITPQEKQLVNFDIQTVITHAIDQKIPVDTMERLLAMAEKMQAIKAKQEFDKAMAKFQSECPTIEKTKAVYTNSGSLAYKYAPIESVIEQVKQALTNNGFSYSTNMEMLENGVKVFVKVTHIMGHSEITEMTVPLGTKTQIMSQSQVVAAASTFAKRYAFLNAFGIMTGDEDNDGANIEQPEYTHNGEIVEKPQQTGEVKPTEKQLKFIKDLATKKGYTMADIAEMQKKVKRTPTQIIDYLKGCPPKIEELPVIQQEPSGDEASYAVDSGLQEIADKLDF